MKTLFLTICMSLGMQLHTRVFTAAMGVDVRWRQIKMNLFRLKTIINIRFSKGAFFGD